MVRKYLVSLTLVSLVVFSTSGQAQRLTEEKTCVFYSLSDLGDDPKLGFWVMESLPLMIAPGTWTPNTDVAGGLSYYPPRKVLAVSHTPTVQRQVAAFLENLKKELAGGKALPMRKFTDDSVVPAQFLESRPTKPIEPSQMMPYAVPAPPKQPKHLFHFIIRYEGAGIIDENVAEVLKAMNGATTTPQAAETPRAATPPDATTPPENENRNLPMPRADDAPAQGLSALPPSSPQGIVHPVQYLSGAGRTSSELTKKDTNHSVVSTHPKHLFHFIIRYEGAGPDDSNWTQYVPSPFYLNQYEANPNNRWQNQPNELKTPASTLPSTRSESAPVGDTTSPPQPPSANSPPLGPR